MTCIKKQSWKKNKAKQNKTLSGKTLLNQKETAKEQQKVHILDQRIVSIQDFDI